MNPQKLKLKPLVASVALGLSTLLAGCNGGSGSDGNDDGPVGPTPTPTTNIQLSGLVVKGLLKSGTVSIFLDEDNNGSYDDQAYAQADIDSSGRYSATIPEGYTGPVNAVVSTGASGSMVCDIQPSCVSNGELYNFGQEVPLPAGFSLEAVDRVTSDSTTEKTINLTSLSHLAAAYAKSEGASAESVQFANEKVAKLLGVTNITGTDPVDITNANALKNASDNARRLSLMSAAMVKQAAQTDGAIGDELNKWAFEFAANNGGLIVNVAPEDLEGSLSVERLITDMDQQVQAISSNSSDAELIQTLEQEQAALNVELAEIATEPEGEVESPDVDESKANLSSAAEAKTFVDDVRTWSTLINEEQLNSDGALFAEEADLVVNSLDAGALLNGYYAQYGDMFSSFAFFESNFNTAMSNLEQGMGEMAPALDYFGSYISEQLEAAMEAGASSGSIPIPYTNITLDFTLDSAGSVEFTNLPQSLPLYGNTLVVSRASAQIVADSVTGEPRSFELDLQAAFTDSMGSVLTGEMTAQVSAAEDAVLGVTTGSAITFKGSLTTDTAGTIQADISANSQGITVSDLSYNYQGSDGSISLDAEGSELKIAGLWDVVNSDTYTPSYYDWNTGQYIDGVTETYTWHEQAFDVHGQLKGQLTLASGGHSLEAHFDAGLSQGYYNAHHVINEHPYQDFYLQDSQLTFTHANGQVLALSSEQNEGRFTLRHNAISYQQGADQLALESAVLTISSDELAYILSELVDGYYWGSTFPLEVSLTGVKVTHQSQTDDNSSSYEFSGDLESQVILALDYDWGSGVAVSEETMLLSLSAAGRFANVSEGKEVSATFHIAAPNGDVMMSSEYWRHAVDYSQELLLGRVEVNNSQFTTHLWNESDVITDTNGEVVDIPETVINGQLIDGGIRFNYSYSDGEGYSQDITRTLPCSDDSSLEQCAKTANRVNADWYGYSETRKLVEVFTDDSDYLYPGRFSETPSNYDTSYIIRKAERQSDGNYNLLGYRRLRNTETNLNLYANMNASIHFQAELPSLSEPVEISLTGDVSNLTAYGDPDEASIGLVNAKLKYGARELLLSTQLGASEEIIDASTGFLKFTNAQGTELLVRPHSSGTVLTGTLRSADQTVWGRVFEYNDTLVVRYSDGAIDPLILPNSGGLATLDQFDQVDLTDAPGFDEVQ